MDENKFIERIQDLVEEAEQKPEEKSEEKPVRREKKENQN